MKHHSLTPNLALVRAVRLRRPATQLLRWAAPLFEECVRGSIQR